MEISVIVFLMVVAAVALFVMSRRKNRGDGSASNPEMPEGGKIFEEQIFDEDGKMKSPRGGTNG